MVLNAITLPFLALLIMRNSRDERSLSPHFVANLTTYLLGIFMCTPYTGYVLFWWRGDGGFFECWVEELWGSILWKLSRAFKN